MSEITPVIRLTVQKFKSGLPWGGEVRSLIDNALQAEAFSDGNSYTRHAIETAKKVILDVYNELTLGDESNIHYGSQIFDNIIFLMDTNGWYTINHN